MLHTDGEASLTAGRSRQAAAFFPAMDLVQSQWSRDRTLGWEVLAM